MRHTISTRRLIWKLEVFFFSVWHWVAAVIVCWISEHVAVDITYSRGPYLLSKTKSHSTTSDLVLRGCHVRTGFRTPDAYLGRKCKSGDSFNWWSRLCHSIPFTDWPRRERAIIYQWNERSTLLIFHHDHINLFKIQWNIKCWKH